MNLQSEVIVAQKALLLSKDELLLSKTNEHEQEMIIKDLIRQKLSAEGRLSVRGALEWVRNQIMVAKESELKMDWTSQSDSIFNSLSKNLHFVEVVQKIAKSKQMSTRYLNGALATIWNTSSKHFHGREGGVFVRADDFSSLDCLILVAIFKRYKVPYVYINKEGVQAEYIPDPETLAAMQEDSSDGK